MQGIPLSRFQHSAQQLKQAGSDELCAYIYDLAALQQHAQRLKHDLPQNWQMFYAVKANAELPILDTLAPELDGFEVASGGELSLIREHHPDTPVIFGGPGKTDAELQLALDSDVELLHVESLYELQRLSYLAEQQQQTVSVLLRLNVALDSLPSTTLTMGGKPTPFGIELSALDDCMALLAGQSRLQLKGFHFHLVSHQLVAEQHLALLADYFRLVRQLEADYQLQVEHINVGGGIGINYRQPGQQFDWAVFAQGLHRLNEELDLHHWQIRFECGRYLTAFCGCYVMEVMDIKHNLGETFVVARGGTHHFRTPAAQSHSHPCLIEAVEDWDRPWGRPAVDNCDVNVVGQLCTPKDRLVTGWKVEQLRAGDLLLFPYAGAYGWNISHQNFLRHPAPKVVYLPAER